jgi:hypothetical protein
MVAAARSAYPHRVGLCRKSRHLPGSVAPDPGSAANEMRDYLGDSHMYIGFGTLLLILLVFVVVSMMRRTRA